jgi:electron transfer flavoprotein alpha subunit
VNTTGWLKGSQIAADGTGIVSHAGVALVRALADNIGLTAGLSKALASRRQSASPSPAQVGVSMNHLG